MFPATIELGSLQEACPKTPSKHRADSPYQSPIVAGNMLQRAEQIRNVVASETDGALKSKPRVVVGVRGYSQRRGCRVHRPVIWIGLAECG
jgi:hypothetical protein